MSQVRTSNRKVSHGAGFWIVAIAFLLVMAYSTVPTPLYPLYQELDHFPVSIVTVIFAAYAVGVVFSLFFLGHISDWTGRRRMLVIAVLVSAVSAVMFLAVMSVPGLIAALGRNVARQTVIRAGLPITIAGTTVNRFCGSGLQAIAMGAG